MVNSGKKYTLAINYTVATEGTDNIYCFQRNKNNAVVQSGTLDKSVGTHTAVFAFDVDSTSGSAEYSPCWLYATVGNKLTLHWAALYEGEYTAETLPPYIPKGYGAELAECMRYFIEWRFGSSSTIAIACKTSNSLLVGCIPMPTEFRSAPAITFSGLTLEDSSKTATVTGMARRDAATTGVMSIAFSCDASALSYGVLYRLCVASGGKITFSADL